MPRYCVNRNAQSNGDHEVHISRQNVCLPAESNRLDLGVHDTCQSAVRAARQYFEQVNGCAWCARSCHTQ